MIGFVGPLFSGVSGWRVQPAHFVERVVPALVALALVAVVWVALHAYEFIWWHEARADTRALRDPDSAS